LQQYVDCTQRLKYNGSYSDRAYNDVSALTCYNLRYAYYRISEIEAHSEYGVMRYEKSESTTDYTLKNEIEDGEIEV